MVVIEIVRKPAKLF